jgi:hypothetical protein
MEGWSLQIAKISPEDRKSRPGNAIRGQVVGQKKVCPIQQQTGDLSKAAMTVPSHPDCIDRCQPWYTFQLPLMPSPSYYTGLSLVSPTGLKLIEVTRQVRKLLAFSPTLIFLNHLVPNCDRGPLPGILKPGLETSEGNIEPAGWFLWWALHFKEIGNPCRPQDQIIAHQYISEKMRTTNHTIKNQAKNWSR